MVAWLAADAFMWVFKMVHVFVLLYIFITLAVGASARRMKSLLMPGTGLKE